MTLLLIIVAVAGCKPNGPGKVVVEDHPAIVDDRSSRPSENAFCDEQISLEVVRAIHIKTWNELTVHEGATMEDLDKERAEIQKVFVWSKTIKDPDVRSCYEAWLADDDENLRESYVELDGIQYLSRWKKTHHVPSYPGDSK